MNRVIVDHPIFRLIVPIPYGALLYLVLLIINDNLSALNDSFFSGEMFFCIIVTYLVLECIQLVNRFVFRADNKSFRNMLLQVIVGLLSAVAVCWLGLWIYFKFILGYQYLGGFTTEFKVFALLFGVTGILYDLLFVSHYLLMKRNDQLIEQEQTLKELLESELNAYQTDINPTLFFESLESAITLLAVNPDEAELFLDNLAMVYRYILTGRGKDLVTLEKEMEACDYLLHLINVKYRNQVNVNFSIDPQKWKIIPGAVLGLVEQIVNDTIISEAKPLKIELYYEDNYLIIAYVQNQHLGINDNASHFDTLQKAYAVVSEKPVLKVQAYGECFYKIPLNTANQQYT